MNTDKNFPAVVIGQRGAAFEIQSGIVVPGQHDFVTSFQLSCQYSGKIQRNRFFGGTIRSGRPDIVAAMPGIEHNYLSESVKQRPLRAGRVGQSGNEKRRR